VRPRSSGRPTLDEVAARAGVSPSTVSRVVRGSTPVSPALQRAVREAVAAVGYVPNLAARSLVTSRTDSVGLVIPESGPPLFGDPFFAAVTSGITAVFADTPLRFVIILAKSQVDRRWLEKYVRSRHVDGVMVTCLHGHDPLLDLFGRADVPVVGLGRPLDGEVRSYVDADNYGGGRAAAEHLVRRGRRRIATITGIMDMRAAVERLAGYRDVLAEAGLRPGDELVANGGYTVDGGYRATLELLDGVPALDAVFAASDVMASGALRALRERGRRVPDDVALVGFGGDPGTEDFDPPLTTVAQPAEEMGVELARLMLRALADPGAAGRQVVMPTRLLVRASS
jgi:DNA-binding LacI/PurR family transcriptional regulator